MGNWTSPSETIIISATTTDAIGTMEIITADTEKGKAMAFSKQIRKAVYGKFNGRCAYCGKQIEYKDMQIDHFIAKRGYRESGSDDLANLMPSCRMCNHYKRANPLELFRIYIQEIPMKLRQNYIYKVGLAYGNVIENEKPIVFYFEQVGERKDNG